MAKVPRNTWILILLLVVGSMFGTLLGNLLKDIFPFLYYSQTIGLNPATIDLGALTVTLGLNLKVNIATIIGFFIALFIYIRL
ncbi:MAG: DUF4321 domain-containing protein [Firmicutes bacterium]|nr:DUF4321 domain-containing protein [Bacillota bacterium]